MKVALAAGAAGAAGAFSLAYGSQLLRPSEEPGTEVRDTLYFHTNPADSPQWWDPLEARPMRVTDFELWRGAPGIWRAEFKENSIVPGTGLPVLVVCVPRDIVNFQAPNDANLPAGVGLYYDDPIRDLRIVVFYSRCTHFCCRTSWRIAPAKPELLAEAVPGPTRDVYGQEPICCLCHYGMFEPMVLTWGAHPPSARGDIVRYIGGQVIRGPPTRPLPVVPVRGEGDFLAGVMVNPHWYDAFCV